MSVYNFFGITNPPIFFLMEYLQRQSKKKKKKNSAEKPVQIRFWSNDHTLSQILTATSTGTMNVRC